MSDKQKPQQFQSRMPERKFVTAMQWPEGDAEPPEAMGLRNEDGFWLSPVGYMGWKPGEWRVFDRGYKRHYTEAVFRKHFEPIPEPSERTPGAVGAAREILTEYNMRNSKPGDLPDHEWIEGLVPGRAAIIEKHTRAGELLEALKALLLENMDYDTETRRNAHALIADAQRTDGGEAGE